MMMLDFQLAAGSICSLSPNGERESTAIVAHSTLIETAQCGGMGIQTGGFPENRIRFNTTSSATSNGFR
jgi:hypothetical protein